MVSREGGASAVEAAFDAIERDRKSVAAGEHRLDEARLAVGAEEMGKHPVASDERTHQTVQFMRSTGLPATFTEPQEVAANAIEAIRTDSFWARPSLEDEPHRETVEWEAQIYRTRAETLIARARPDPYLWGPASHLLGP